MYKKDIAAYCMKENGDKPQRLKTFGSNVFFFVGKNASRLDEVNKNVNQPVKEWIPVENMLIILNAQQMKKL